MGICITGCGKAQPGLIVENEKVEKIVDTSDEWIYTRTGIKERRISVNESTTDLAVAASLEAIGAEAAEFPEGVHVDHVGNVSKALDPKDIDLIIVTTITPDTLVPSEACLLKRRIGADNAIAFDINAACTGFIYGLSIALNMMSASHPEGADCPKMKPIRHALVVSSERLSRLTDWLDRNTCVLFGDGAGVMAIEWSDEENDALSVFLKNTDDETNALTCPESFDSPIPFDVSGPLLDRALFNGEITRDAMKGISPDPAHSNIADELEIPKDARSDRPSQVIRMNGQKVFKFASKAMEEAVREACELANVSVDDIALVVPHQANYRIIEYAAKRLDMQMEKFQVSIEYTGNSSSSCLPMALVDALCAGKITTGSLVCLVAFGGGLTSGAALLRF